MGFLDRILGRDEPENTAPAPTRNTGSESRPLDRTDDEIAVERYQYLLRTAPPETIEKVHTEAFGKLTAEQRDLLFRQLSDDAAAGEAPTDAAPASLARAATRAEMQQPGTLARSFGNGQGANGQGGMGFGSVVGGSLLGTVAGFVIGSALVSAFMPNDLGADSSADGADAAGETGSGEAGSDADAGAADADAAGTGGDSGGGDFSGGDFSGGDFGF